MIPTYAIGETYDAEDAIFFQKCAAMGYAGARGEHGPQPYQGPHDRSYFICAQELAAKDAATARKILHIEDTP